MPVLLTRPSWRFTPGFSLIEVMIGLTAITLLLLVTYTIFIAARQTQRRVDARAEVVQNERSILDRLTREVRQANTIATALPATELLFEDGHGNLDNVPIQYLRYHLQGTDLYREVRYYYFASAPDTHVYYNETDDYGNPPSLTTTEDRLIGQYVTSLTFSGHGTITITLTFTLNGETLTTSSDVTPRNIK